MAKRHESAKRAGRRSARKASDTGICPQCGSAEAHVAATEEGEVLVPTHHVHPVEGRAASRDALSSAAQWTMGNAGSWTSPGVRSSFDAGFGHRHHLGPPVLSPREQFMLEHPHGYRGFGPKGYKRSDRQVRDAVCDALYAAADVDACDVSVKVRHGEVTLLGTIADRQQKRIAEAVCESCAGVVDVHNALSVAEHAHAN